MEACVELTLEQKNSASCAAKLGDVCLNLRNLFSGSALNVLWQWQLRVMGTNTSANATGLLLTQINGHQDSILQSSLHLCEILDV